MSISPVKSNLIYHYVAIDDLSLIFNQVVIMQSDIELILSVDMQIPYILELYMYVQLDIHSNIKDIGANCIFTYCLKYIALFID